ncbi:MAG: nuclear transport factor 2 family protein [Candidatus Dormibacteria bacterium]
MSDAAMETVFDHFHARRRRDLDGIAAGLDPDVVHQGVRPELVCNGRAAVLERVAASFDSLDTGVERLELNAAGEAVVVGISGPRFREIPFLDGELYMVFRVRDGMILRIDDYRTRDEALHAAGAQSPAPASAAPERRSPRVGARRLSR